MMRKGLEKIASFGTHHPKPVLIALLVLTLLALIPASRLKFETRLAPLLPKEIVPELERASKEWQGGQFLFLFVLPPKGHRLIDYDLFIRQLKTRIGTLPSARKGNLENAIPKGDLLAALISGYGPLLMDEEGIGELERTLTKEEIQIGLERSLQPEAEGKSTLERFDPLRLSPLLLRRFPLLSLIDVTQSQNYLVSKDGSTALLIFGLSEPASRHEFSKKLKADIHKIQKEIWGKMERIESLGKKGRNLPPPRVVASGPHFVVLDNRDALRSTLWQTALIALIPIFFGGGLLLAAWALAGMPLNLLNLFWTPMLFGMGIDGALYLLGRFREGQTGIAGATLEVATPIFFSSVTTIAGFGSNILSAFPAVRSSGLMIAVGMVWILTATLILLPAVISTLCEKK